MSPIPLAGRALLLCALALGACQAAGPSPAEAGDPISDETTAARTGGVSALDAMQGTWRAEDDPDVVLRVEGDRATDLYRTEPPHESTLRAVRACDDRAPEPTSVFVVMDDGSASAPCVEVLRADGGTLELRAGTATRRYRRDPA